MLKMWTYSATDPLAYDSTDTIEFTLGEATLDATQAYFVFAETIDDLNEFNSMIENAGHCNFIYSAPGFYRYIDGFIGGSWVDIDRQELQKLESTIHKLKKLKKCMEK